MTVNRIIPATLCAIVLLTSTGFAQDSNAPGQTLVLGLQGYSPVSYLEKQLAEPGSPAFRADHEGVTYFFTSAQQRRQFAQNPQRYLPAYGGYCAYGCAVNGKFTPDPTNFTVVDGKTHLFLKNEQLDTKVLWDKEELRAVKKRADAYWQQQNASRAYAGARNLPASGVAIDGYSPVSYFTLGKAEPGDPRFQVEHRGVTYHLTSSEQVELFKKDPDRYEPAYGGWCAFGMAVADKFPVDPKSFKIVDGRLLLFLNNAQVNALALWNEGKQNELLRKAETHWKKVSGG